MREDRVKKELSGVRKKGVFRPSPRRFREHLNLLIKWKFIEERQEEKGRKRKFYTILDIGRLSVSLYDNKKFKYADIIIIIIVIVGKAHFGMTTIHKIDGPVRPGDFGLENPITGYVTNYSTEHFDGVISKDLLNMRDISIQSNLGIRDMEVSEREVDECISILKEKGIIQSIGYNGQLRYQVVDKTYQDFLQEVWVKLFGLIDDLIRCKLSLEGPNSEERDWMERHYGKKRASRDINSYYEFRKRIESKKPDDDPVIQKIREKYTTFINEKRNKIAEYKVLIHEIYEKIDGDYSDKLQELPGIKEILLEFVCPKKLLVIL